MKEQTRIVNQIRGWLATWGATVPRRRTGSWWTRSRLGGRRVAAPAARAGRARGGAPRRDRRPDRGPRRRAAGGRRRRPRRLAAWRLVQLKGVAAATARFCSRKAWCGGAFTIAGKWAAFWASRRPRIKAGTSRTTRASVARAYAPLQAMSIQLAWNGCAATDRPSRNGLAAIRHAGTGAAHRHRGGGAARADSAVALCDHRRSTRGAQLKAA